VRSLLLLAVCACAGPAAQAPPPPPPSKPIEEVVKEPIAEPSPGERAPPTDQSGAHVISRSQLLPVLAGGPGAFLQKVDVAPRFADGRFQGWRLAKLDERYGGGNLQPGDVIVRVNGRSVEKPDQLMEVWQSLKAAPALELELLRNGAPMKLRWPIEP
jgi:type II secretory pathway component PulC